ncbi:MAG: glycosyltransferase family 4 protein [Tannerella sp.]|jgi:glycosyltransferase involved in cell wall biosynthesis|nr:glycosyltransferase family 4 protein [Tannerella sp.]
MKICVFGTRGFPNVQGGVEKHCENLYPLLASEDIHVTVFRRKPYVKSSEIKRAENLTFIDLPSTRIKGFEAVFHSFLSTLYCMFLRPDIVHIHNIGPALFSPLLRLARLKIVLTYHSANYEHSKWGFFSRNLLKLSEKIALSTADRIIFVNKVKREQFCAKILAKSVFIPNGIHSPVIISDTEYLLSKGIKPEQYILAVGRITPEKGFDYLLKAFVAAKMRNYQLVIAGSVEGELSYSLLLNKLSSSDKIIFTGFITGKPLHELYSHAALFVLPSYNEGMPIVLLEAMSYKLPILASDILPNKSLELPEESYFETGNEKMLAAKLKRINGCKRVDYDNIENYGLQQVATKTMSVFNTLNK